jgi:6-phosphogluconolactonase
MGFLFVGSYGPQHGGHGDGVVTLGLDHATGRLTEPLHTALTDSPSYLAISADKRTLYATHECDEGRVTTLRVNPDGSLATLHTIRTAGHGPCHVLRHGSELIVCDYRDGIVTGIPCLLGDAPSGAYRFLDVRELGEEPHPHAAVPIPESNRLAITCLGLDKLLTCEVPTNGRPAQLVAASPAPRGSGPRTMAFSRTGAAFTANELDSTVSRYDYDQRTGRFTHVRSVPSTCADKVNYPANIVLSADGRFAYTSNRGADTIAVFDIRGNRLEFIDEVPTGAWPQHLTLAGQHLIAAGQLADRISVHRLDVRSGTPRPASREIEVASPSCTLTA